MLMEKVPCPMRNSPDCPIFQQEGECYEDRHHKYWPSPDYSSRVEKQFRQLEVNKVDICRWIHNTIHAVVLPPEHPTTAEMRQAIREEEQ